MTKPLPDLSLDDLDSHIVWRVEDRDGVEIAVPIEATDVSSDSDDLLVVRTRFRLANGWIFIGYCAPGDWPGLEFVPPVILHDGRTLELIDAAGKPTGGWDGLAPNLDLVFPVRAEPDVSVDGHRVSRLYARDGSDPDVPTPAKPGWGRRIVDFLDGLGD